MSLGEKKMTFEIINKSANNQQINTLHFPERYCKKKIVHLRYFLHTFSCRLLVPIKSHKFIFRSLHNKKIWDF